MGDELSDGAAGESQKEDLRGRWKKRGLSLQKPKGATCVRTSLPGALSVGRQEARPQRDTQGFLTGNSKPAPRPSVSNKGDTRQLNVVLVRIPTLSLLES